MPGGHEIPGVETEKNNAKNIMRPVDRTVAQTVNIRRNFAFGVILGFGASLIIGCLFSDSIGNRIFCVFMWLLVLSTKTLPKSYDKVSSYF